MILFIAYYFLHAVLLLVIQTYWSANCPANSYEYDFPSGANAAIGAKLPGIQPLWKKSYERPNAKPDPKMGSLLHLASQLTHTSTVRCFMCDIEITEMFECSLTEYNSASGTLSRIHEQGTMKKPGMHAQKLFDAVGFPIRHRLKKCW